MRLAITGGTGLVGRFLVQEALAAGDDVTLLSRRAPEPGFFAGPVAHLLYSLTAPAPMLHEFDALIHCSFDHIPGRYRGGEGDDPEGFRRANLEGSLTLIRAAEAAGVTRFVFLSSRAVYGRQPPGARLQEDTPCHPNTLYGEVKLAIEQALAASALQSLSIRATGVYGPPGPGQTHKWQSLFNDFEAGAEIAPRLGSELHGADLAQACRLALRGALDDWAHVNASDLLLDRRDLLAQWASLTNQKHPLPPAADPCEFNEMDCSRLLAAGWQPQGQAGLGQTLRDMARTKLAPPPPK